MPLNPRSSLFPIISVTNKQIDVYASEQMLITDALVQGVSFINADLSTAEWVALSITVQQCSYERNRVKLNALY